MALRGVKENKSMQNIIGEQTLIYNPGFSNGWHVYARKIDNMVFLYSDGHSINRTYPPNNGSIELPKGFAPDATIEFPLIKSSTPSGSSVNVTNNAVVGRVQLTTTGFMFFNYDESKVGEYDTLSVVGFYGAKES